jgi:RNA-binding protein YlmH
MDSLAQSKDDKMLLAQLADRVRQCSDAYMITNSSFLDLRQRSVAEGMLRYQGSLHYEFYGGYEDADRTVAVFLPEYIDGSAEEYFAKNPEDNPLTVLRATLSKGSPHLTHRDYLGSMLGLGIKREVTGDILVREDGADIVVLKDIACYIMTNMEKAGRARLRLTEVSISELIRPESTVKEIVKSVSQTRLDSVVAAIYGLSRGKAMEAVTSGIVYVNDVEAGKPERHVDAGDKIVLRGRGKAVIKSTDGRSAKGKTVIVADRYV